MCDHKDLVVGPLCPVGFLNDLDVCDLENYKHPPFMWTLWYMALVGKKVYDKVKELLEDKGDGDGGDGGGKKDDKGDDDKDKQGDEEEAPPPEEDEEKPAEEPAAEEPAAEEEEN